MMSSVELASPPSLSMMRVEGIAEYHSGPTATTFKWQCASVACCVIGYPMCTVLMAPAIAADVVLCPYQLFNEASTTPCAVSEMVCNAMNKSVGNYLLRNAGFIR
jgi:hypothetical protein